MGVKQVEVCRNANQNNNSLPPYDGPLDALAGHYGISGITLGRVNDPQVITTTPGSVKLDSENVVVRVQGHSDLATISTNAGSLALRWGVIAGDLLVYPYDIAASDWEVELDPTTQRLLATIGSEVAVYAIALDGADVVLSLDVNDSRHTGGSVPIGFVLTPRTQGSHPWMGDWAITRAFIEGGDWTPGVLLTQTCGIHEHVTLGGPYGILIGEWSVDSEGFLMGNESYRSWDASECPGAPDSPDYQVEEPILAFLSVDEANGTVSLMGEVDTQMYMQHLIQVQGKPFRGPRSGVMHR